MSWIKNLSPLEWLIVVAVLALTALVVFCPGCGGRKVNPVKNALPGSGMGSTPIGAYGNPLSGAKASIVAVYRTNWALSVAVIGVTASVFAICMGMTKLGTAGLCSSFAMAAMSVAMIRYAWAFGIGGLLVGTGVGLRALAKNRETIFGFVDGFQAVKEKLVPSAGRSGDRDHHRDLMNEVMGGHINSHGAKLVAKRKKIIEKQKSPVERLGL